MTALARIGASRWFLEDDEILASDVIEGPHRGTLGLIEGCVIQIAGLAALVVTLSIVSTPPALLLALVLTIFGYGQGLVMAPLSSAVLSTVRPANAGSGAGLYGTTAQIASVESRSSARYFLRSRTLIPRASRCSGRLPCSRLRL